jgi:hypothetical protein
MNRTASLIFAWLIFVGGIWAFAQVRNEGLANQIIAGRQKNAAMMKQYNWTCMTQFIDNGSVKDTRIESVSYGPDGNLQQTVINDQHASMPGGFVRRRIADNEKKDMEKYLKGLHELLNQYTLPSAGAMINFVSKAAIQTGDTAAGVPTLTLTGGNVVNPGDSVATTVSPTNFQTLSTQVSATYDGNQVKLNATFRTIASGLTHLQYATIEVPDKNITLQVHNYDYVPNN